MGNPKVYVAIVLDRSGSMFGARNETIAGFNSTIAEIQKTATEKDVFVSLVTFNEEVEFKFFNENIDFLAELTLKDYVPDGLTAMYDAVGDTLHQLQAEVVDDEESSYLVIVISDGFENASKRRKRADIAELIQSLQKTNRWTFTYLGANQDLSKVAEDLGIPLANMASYRASGQGTDHANKLRLSAVGNYFTSSSGLSATASANFYNTEENAIADFTPDDITIDPLVGKKIDTGAKTDADATDSKEE